jgi:hypothetical protein
VARKTVARICLILTMTYADLDNKDDDEDVNMAGATIGDSGSINLDQFDNVDG